VVSVTQLSRAHTAGRIEVLFGIEIHRNPRNIALDRVLDSPTARARENAKILPTAPYIIIFL